MVKPQLRFIFWDLDDTLFDAQALVAAANLRVATRFKEYAPTGSKLADASIDEIAGVYEKAREELGSNEMHFPRIFQHFNVGREYIPMLTSIGRIAYEEVKKEKLVLFPNVIDTLLWCRDRGVYSGILTNGLEDKQWYKVNYLGISRLVNPVVISHSIELKNSWTQKYLGEKPRRIAYEEALSEVNNLLSPNLPLSPEEVALVDDRYKGLFGAKICGWHTIKLPSLGKYSHESAESTLAWAEKKFRLTIDRSSLDPKKLFVDHTIGSVPEIKEVLSHHYTLGSVR